MQTMSDPSQNPIPSSSGLASSSLSSLTSLFSIKSMTNKRKSSNPVQDTAKKLKSEFTCPICLDILEEAQVTKCGHSFCLKCILRSFEDNKRCPHCSFATEEFFPNFLLNELASKYRMLQQSPHPSDKKNNVDRDLPKTILNNCSKLDLKNIDTVIDALKDRKAKLKEESGIKQFTLVKEFLENSRNRLLKQMKLLKRQLPLVERDYKLIMAKLEEQNHSTSVFSNDDTSIDIHETVNTSGSDAKDNAMNSSSKVNDSRPNDPSFSSLDNIPSVGFNSIKLGQCSHFDPKWPQSVFSEESFSDQRKKMNLYINELEKCYLQHCRKNEFEHCQNTSNTIEGFGNDLHKFLAFTRIRPLAILNYSRDSSNMVSSIEFDKDEEFFAIGGVSRKIKLFDYSMVVSDSLGHNYPISDIECGSKISCISWNSFIKSNMASSDYEGNVILWDAFLGQKLHVYREHQKRCWSVDFNKIDINLLASGSDDGNVKLYSSNMQESVLTIGLMHNICCVKFNPESMHHLACSSADHHAYYYDLRNTRSAMTVFQDHTKAVSFVRFLNKDELISASVESQIKLYNINHPNCLRTYTGHVNDKNFVGLAANNDYFACGSEDNSVYIYYKGISKHMLSYAFNKIEKDDVNEFICSVCWKKSGNVILAANSQGVITVLEIV